MNALVKKEVCLLLPSFSVACALALAAGFIPGNFGHRESVWLLLPLIACPLFVLMMALESFGSELTAGTFPLLLAQPVPRQKLWNLKVRLLAVACLVVALFWSFAFGVQEWRCGQVFDYSNVLPGVALVGMVVFSGALWTVLLLRQEMQLYRSPFIMAGTLALLHLAVVLLRHFGNFPKNSLTDFVLENFWLLWLGMPLLVGCAAAAEERRLGTLAGQLCLPVRRRTQFIVKAGTVLGLSVFFGAIMPALLELPRVPSEFPFWSAGFKFHGLQAMYLQAGLWPAGQAVLRILVSAPGLAVAIGLISFYASSMSRNALQSLALAILGILGAWSLAIGLLSGSLIAGDPWLGPLIILVGVPALTAILLFLSGRNWKRANMGWQDWLANLVVLLVIVAFFDVVVAARY